MSDTEQLGPLPEHPAFYMYQFQSHYGPVWRSDADAWNGQRPSASECLYTADQMRAYALQERAKERERCARLCDAAKPRGGRMWNEGQAACYDCLSHVAAYIREGTVSPTLPG